MDLRAPSGVFCVSSAFINSLNTLPVSRILPVRGSNATTPRLFNSSTTFLVFPPRSAYMFLKAVPAAVFRMPAFANSAMPTAVSSRLTPYC